MFASKTSLVATSRFLTRDVIAAAVSVAVLLSNLATANVVLEYQGNRLSATDAKLPAEPGVTAIRARIELGINALPKGTNTLFGGNFRQPIGWMVSAEISDGVNTYKWSPKGPEYWDISLKTDANGTLISWNVRAWTQSGDQTHASIGTTHYMPFGCPKLDQSSATVFIKHVPHSYSASTCNIGTMKVTSSGGTVASAPSMPALKPIIVAEVRALKAQGGGTATSIKFTNHTDSTVSVSWIDYSGQPRAYGSLKPNESYVQSTYTAHPWLVTDAATGKPIVGFLPDAQPAEAVIGGTAQPVTGANAAATPVSAGVVDSSLNSALDVELTWMNTLWEINYVPGSVAVQQTQPLIADLTEVHGKYSYTMGTGAKTRDRGFQAFVARRDGGLVVRVICGLDQNGSPTACLRGANGKVAGDALKGQTVARIARRDTEIISTYRADLWDLTSAHWVELAVLDRVEVTKLLQLASYPNIWNVADLSDFALEQLRFPASAHLQESPEGQALKELNEAGINLRNLARQHPAEWETIAEIQSQPLLLFKEVAEALDNNHANWAPILEKATLIDGQLARAALSVVDLQIRTIDRFAESIYPLFKYTNQYRCVEVTLHSYSRLSAESTIRQLNATPYDDIRGNMFTWWRLLEQPGTVAHIRDTSPLRKLLELPNLEEMPTLLSVVARDTKQAADAPWLNFMKSFQALDAALKVKLAEASSLRELQAKREWLLQEAAAAAKSKTDQRTPEGEKAFDDLSRLSDSLSRNSLFPAVLELSDAYITLLESLRARADKGDFDARLAGFVLIAEDARQAQSREKTLVGLAPVRAKVPLVREVGAVTDILVDPSKPLDVSVLQALSKWPRFELSDGRVPMATIGLLGCAACSTMKDRLAEISTLVAHIPPQVLAFLHDLSRDYDPIDFDSSHGVGVESARLVAEGNATLGKSRAEIAAFWRVWAPFIREIYAQALGDNANAGFVLRIFNAEPDMQLSSSFLNSPRHQALVSIRNARGFATALKADSVQRCYKDLEVDAHTLYEKLGYSQLQSDLAYCRKSEDELATDKAAAVERFRLCRVRLEKSVANGNARYPDLVDPFAFPDCAVALTGVNYETVPL